MGELKWIAIAILTRYGDDISYDESVSVAQKEFGLDFGSANDVANIAEINKE